MKNPKTVFPSCSMLTLKLYSVLGNVEKRKRGKAERIPHSPSHTHSSCAMLKLKLYSVLGNVEKRKRGKFLFLTKPLV